MSLRAHFPELAAFGALSKLAWAALVNGPAAIPVAYLVAMREKKSQLEAAMLAYTRDDSVMSECAFLLWAQLTVVTHAGPLPVLAKTIRDGLTPLEMALLACKAYPKNVFHEDATLCVLAPFQLQPTLASRPRLFVLTAVGRLNLFAALHRYHLQERLAAWPVDRTRPPAHPPLNPERLWALSRYWRQYITRLGDRLNQMLAHQFLFQRHIFSHPTAQSQFQTHAMINQAEGFEETEARPDMRAYINATLFDHNWEEYVTPTARDAVFGLFIGITAHLCAGDYMTDNFAWLVEDEILLEIHRKRPYILLLRHTMDGHGVYYYRHGLMRAHTLMVVRDTILPILSLFLSDLHSDADHSSPAIIELYAFLFDPTNVPLQSRLHALI